MSRIRDGSLKSPQVLQMFRHIEKPTAENGQHVDAEGQQEEEEITIVPLPNAVVDPWAMVVKILQI